MTPSGPRPTLIYDGECGICTRWVQYWERLTGGQVDYRPYQEAASDYPSIPLDDFRRAIQFIEPDGQRHAGAAATYRVLRYAPGRRGWWWLYTHVPGVAPAAERAYNFFARRRDLLDTLTKLLWGPLGPARYDLVSFVFLRGLGVIYFAAFASLYVQILGLVGSGGILPIESYLRWTYERLGDAAYYALPTLFWLNASDTAVIAGTLVGMALAVLVTVGIAIRPALIGLFALYLSYTHAGQDFMMFQWDLLLLESGFLAIFLPGGSRIVVWLYRWLVFRYVFMAGAAKLATGDQTWRGLIALEYHFETQPLPTPLAWYAAHLPHVALEGATAAALIVEVGLVLLIFAPRRLRAMAAWCVIGLQLLIMLTGNYNFFNLLTILLCVFLFDDAAMRRVLPARLIAYIARNASSPGRSAVATATVIVIIVVPLGIHRIWELFAPHDLPVLGSVTRALEPFLIVNPYGLFANMTTKRPEIIVEGSDDGQSWHEYDFRYKPGEITREPPWNIPHQPRLDWQMWFAALGDIRQQWWFFNFMRRLLENSPPVLALLASNPFPGHPPKYVRAIVYDYRFSDRQLRAATGQWWTRRREGLYVQAITLTELQFYGFGR
jgi:predicted DCC family thiol-disulfide oxidoreductase YuxK